MIIDNVTQSQVIGVDKESTVNMTIDDSDKAVLMMILSQGLYSDGIGSLIRELTTNALDSQREAGNDNPIRVSLVREEGKFVFKVQDEGVGLSPDRVENVFTKYCASTKRNSDTQLGFFGLGSKAPLAYTDSFFIISRYDSVEYKYMMFKGEEGTNFSLMDMNDTTEHNGVTIKVFLKDENDYGPFIEKMKRQLAYFEGVFFETEYDDIDNGFKIIKNPIWKYSEMNSDKYVHLSLDNVYYQIDFEKLGIEPIQAPLALNMSLKDGIIPTPNRESIQYTPAVKAMILDKLRLLGNFLIEKWNQAAPSATTLKEAITLSQNHGEIVLWHNTEKGPIQGLQQVGLKVDKRFEKVADISMIHVTMPAYPNLPLGRVIQTHNQLMDEFRVVGQIYHGRYKTKLDAGYNSYGYHSNGVKEVFLKEGETLSGLQIEYLKYLGGTINIIRRSKPRRLGKLDKFKTNYNNYFGLLELWKFPKDKWRSIIQDYINLRDVETKDWIKFPEVVPTQEFLDWRKQNKGSHGGRRQLLKEELTVAIGREKEVYDSMNRPTFDKFVYKIGELTKFSRKKSGMYFYTTEDRKEELFGYFNIGQVMETKWSPIKVAWVSERTAKKLDTLKLHNWINIDSIHTTRNRVIAEFLSSYILHEFKTIPTNNYIFSNKYFVEYIDGNLAELIKSVDQQSIHKWNYESNISDSLIYSLLKTYHGNGWLTYKIIKNFDSLYKQIDNLEFLPGINIPYTHQLSGSSDENLISVKLSKILYNKYRKLNFVGNHTKDYNMYIVSVLDSLAPEITEPEKVEEAEAQLV